MSPSLPSPPLSSEDKENRPLEPTAEPRSSPRKGIEWASTKEIISYAPVSGRAVIVPSTSRGPRKSILKPSRPSPPFSPEKSRDETPLPDDALENPHFLEYPVSAIVGKDSTLRELTEAYSILTARIRQSVPPNFFASPTRNTRHALFDPLRREKEPLSAAIVRDLGRVFADPFLPPNTPPSTPRKAEKHCLPTPEDSPAPKKGGMNEEQVKYARDLSTVANATVKFITMAFQVPAIYNVFTVKQLNAILTSLLAIPLAESIRSPTARKTCGFAITALQSQRLPDSILTNAAPRIAFALKRAIEGELGREGKKGATAEAFRAVHDLSTYRPSIFIPIFHIYVTTLLESLLTPSNPLRVLAAYALGGFVLGLVHAEIDFEDVLREVSPVVSEFFLRKEPQEKSQTTILRTLRTALRNTEPTHHAQGPFWAISVLASLTVLLGPALLKEKLLLVEYRGTIDIGLKAKRRIVRAITSTLWGPLIWVWQKWRGSMDDEDDSEQIEDPSEREKVKACFSTMLRMTTHLPIGVSFISALLGESHESCRQDDLLFALFQVAASARQGGESTQRALELLDRFINSHEDEDFYERWTETFLGKLVPKPLLSVSPGLLTVEINISILSPAVECIVAAQPSPIDVRPLADEEKRIPAVWSRIKDAWMLCIEQLEMSENDPVPDTLSDIWSGLVRMGLMSIGGDGSSLLNYGSECAEVLISIFTNSSIDLRERPETESTALSSVSDTAIRPGEDACSAANMRLKLILVRVLWTTMIGILPPSSIIGSWKTMIKFLVKHHYLLVPSSENGSEDEDEALSEWSHFCAQVAAVASADITSLIWQHEWEWDERTRARAWRGYARGWVEDSNGSWREAASILGLPFKIDSTWDMNAPDFAAWSSLLTYAVEKATKDHVAAPEALEYVVSRIEQQHITSLSSTLRVADHLMETFDKHVENCSKLPYRLIDLIHEVLLTSYPPKPRNKDVSAWLLRSLQACISNCPTNLVVELLERLHDGLCTWITDECSLFSTEEYSSEVIPLYQTVLIALQPLPPSIHLVQSFSALLASALQVDLEKGGLLEGRAEALTAFTDFWKNNCAKLETPKAGWSDGILHALELAFPSSPTDAFSTSEDVAPDLDAPSGIGIVSLDSDEDELDVLPRTTTPRRRPANHVPLPASPPVRKRQDSFILPKTPRKSTKYSELTDGPRLPGLFGSLSSAQDRFHRNLCNPSQQSRSASDSSTGSDVAEKENIGPQLLRTKNGMAHSGTKRVSIDTDSSPLRAKRPRTVSCGSDDSQDAQMVEATLCVEKDVTHKSQRVPFGLVNTNANNVLQTPSTKVRASAGPLLNLASTPQSSRMYEKSKMRDYEQQPQITRRSAATEDDDTDDDEYLPSSSDLESEEEDNGPSSSSSPVGPFTPRAARRAEFTIAITQDPASDDIITSSSPTRKIRRLARSERLSSGLKTAKAELNENPASRYLSWTMRV